MTPTPSVDTMIAKMGSQCGRQGAKKKIKESRKEIEDKTELIDSLKQVRTMLLELKESI